MYDELVEGHSLLSNVINLIIVMEAKTIPLADGNEHLISLM
jgi:hypothetical protein